MPFNVSEEDGYRCCIGYKGTWCSSAEYAIFWDYKSRWWVSNSPILESRSSDRECEKKHNSIIYHVKPWVVKILKEFCWSNCRVELSEKRLEGSSLNAGWPGGRLHLWKRSSTISNEVMRNHVYHQSGLLSFQLCKSKKHILSKSVSYEQCTLNTSCSVDGYN